MKKKFFALCIAGTNSGCGKTTITTALIWALKKRGLNVAPFKCGPDYIDPSYHSAASGNPSINLDSWIMSDKVIKESFLRNSSNSDIAVVEGVMGLFDGASSSQTGSTAECAIILNLPVILIVNASGLGASIAPLVYGFTKFNPQVKIRGVIANKIGSKKHRKICEESLKKNSLPPLLGAFPNNYKFHIPERHLGLLPWIENKNKDFFFEGLAEDIEKNLDIDTIINLSEFTQTNSLKQPIYPPPKYLAAIAKDEAFNFYYHDNIHFLRMSGFKIVEISPIRDKKLPEKLDLLYLGGGFPEIFAKELSENCEFRKSVASFAKSGGKIY
ncbi:MAG TPA: cobyrinate a,c-diamide synthase, partial [Victivallales bacterium]|nr:cobyrinate a,c-diamide synthase [Victivallales bacterium]